MKCKNREIIYSTKNKEFILTNNKIYSCILDVLSLPKKLKSTILLTMWYVN